MSFENPIPNQEVEKIVASAIRLGEEIFTGKTHSDAIADMEETYPEWDKDEASKPEDGFLTNMGRFVNRTEAGEIAQKAKQLEHLDARTRHNASDFLDAHNIQELKPKWLK